MWLIIIIMEKFPYPSQTTSDNVSYPKLIKRIVNLHLMTKIHLIQIILKKAQKKKGWPSYPLDQIGVALKAAR
jgi:hypothetical protein